MSKPSIKLKEQREKSRLSQTEVAKLLGISNTTVSRHELGRGLTKDMLQKYASLYKVETYELFHGLEGLVEEEGVEEDGA